MPLNVEAQDFGRNRHRRREAIRSAQATAELSDDVTLVVTGLEDLIDLLNYATGSYTPTTNITVGTGGVNTAHYTHIGGMLTVEGTITLGTSPTMPSNPTITLPPGFSFANFDQFRPVAHGVLYNDSGVGGFPGVLWQNSATSLLFTYAGGTNTTAAAVTSTVPMTWVVGDEILYTFCTRVVTEASFLLLEGGDDILLETGDKIELE